MRVYISLHNFDVVCISETYLDSATVLGDENLEIAGYNLLRANHASNSKRGSVCVYYKSSLGLRLIDVHYLQELLTSEILIGGRAYFRKIKRPRIGHFVKKSPFWKKKLFLDLNQCQKLGGIRPPISHSG